MWIFTIFALLSRMLELKTILSSRLIWEIAYLFLWAPLYMALERMNDEEWSLCKKYIILASGLTAFIALLIVISGNYILYDIFATRSEDLTRTTFFSARIVVYGLWTFMPLGIWFCLMEISKSNEKNTRLYQIMAVIIFSIILINLTRSILLGFLNGLAFVVFGTICNLPRRIPKRILKFTVIIFIISLIFILFSSEFYMSWLGRYEEAKSGGSIEGRIIRNAYVFTKLTKELPFFGNKDYWSLEAFTSYIAGDPHTFLNVWTSYGLIACLIFVGIITISFFRLVKIYFLRKRLSLDSFYKYLFLAGLYIQFHWMMLSGDYLIDLTVFLLIFFFVDLKRLESKMSFTKLDHQFISNN